MYRVRVLGETLPSPLPPDSYATDVLNYGDGAWFEEIGFYKQLGAHLKCLIRVSLKEYWNIWLPWNVPIGVSEAFAATGIKLDTHVLTGMEEDR